MPNTATNDFFSDWRARTRAIYNRYRYNQNNDSVTIEDHVFTILPGVFSPKHHANTAFFAHYVPGLAKQKRFLEIGTGTGAIAVLCALEGAQVVATDINPAAVKNCLQNAKQWGVAVDTRLGSLFEPIKLDERFDTIFWHHPWNYGVEPESDVLLQAGFDYHYQHLEQFFRQAKHYLIPTGKLLLGTGGFARLDLIQKWSKDYGYKLKLLHEQTHLLSDGADTQTQFLLYSLTP